MGCGQPDLPGGVYANVYNMMSFILDVIEDGKIDRIFCKSNFRDWGDGFCNDYLNRPEHCFDGGDCCGKFTSYKRCKKCQCFE